MLSHFSHSQFSWYSSILKSNLMGFRITFQILGIILIHRSMFSWFWTFSLALLKWTRLLMGFTNCTIRCFKFWFSCLLLLRFYNTSDIKIALVSWLKCLLQSSWILPHSWQYFWYLSLCSRWLWSLWMQISTLKIMKEFPNSWG